MVCVQGPAFAYTEDGGATLLHEVAKADDVSVVARLCVAGVPLDGDDVTHGAVRNPPLVTAAAKGSLSAVKALLASGANASCANAVGLTALMAACRRCVARCGLTVVASRF